MVNSHCFGMFWVIFLTWLSRYVPDMREEEMDGGVHQKVVEISQLPSTAAVAGDYGNVRYLAQQLPGQYKLSKLGALGKASSNPSFFWVSCVKRDCFMLFRCARRIVGSQISLDRFFCNVWGCWTSCLRRPTRSVWVDSKASWKHWMTRRRRCFSAALYRL